MSRPEKTTSYMSPVGFRADLPRESATRYWEGPHAQIAGRLPNMAEYVQRHYSPTDHGYWPFWPTVGPIVPSGRRCDGRSPVRAAAAGGPTTTTTP
ncbi:hypothetical protein OG933_02045 [Streptomyces sp. NBC_00016]|uniref:hypothetical protein n=1 Tax=Streptomyces sp. NBC_00016 TaxID=2975622 RepID=UPI00324AC1E0